MSLNYLDTSALMRWVERDVDDPREVNARFGAVTDGVLRGEGRVALSELTLIEFRSAVAKNWRSERAQEAKFDAAWATRARRSVMQEMASGRVEVVSAPPHAADHAVTLVDLVADEHSFPAGAWDTIHLITAARWGYDEGETVKLYTSDSDYVDFVALYPTFTRFVQIADLNAIAPM